MRTDSTFFQHHSYAIALALLLASSAAEEPLTALTTLRDALRTRVDAQLSPLAGGASSWDVRLDLDAGIHRRGGKRLLLRRRGGDWGPATLLDLPNGLELRGIDTTGLVLAGEELRGPVVLRWADTDPEGGDGEERSQTFTLAARLSPTEPRLVLTLHRFLNGADWVLAYRQDGQRWVH